MALILEKVKAVVDRVNFRGWSFIVGELGDGFYIQVSFPESDTETGKDVICKGRKWYVSSWATQEEIVKTCWLAVEIATRHEAMEAFTYAGLSIFHPHTGLNALMNGQTSYELVTRPDPAVAVVEVESNC